MKDLHETIEGDEAKPADLRDNRRATTFLRVYSATQINIVTDTQFNLLFLY